MTSVFIGGSRQLGQLNAQLAHRLNNIMDKRLCVLVGDANGFDRVAQAYLSDNGYREVLVYCTLGEARNNVGNWPIRAVEYHGKDRGFEFYTAKDDAMLREADYGLFAWDGKSKGTFRNVRKMAERQRPCSVYVSPLRQFVTVRTPDDAANLSRGMGAHTGLPEELFSDSWRETAPMSDGCSNGTR